MYYFFSFPNLDLLNQFDNHDFSTIKEVNNNLLLNSLSSLRSQRGEKNNATSGKDNEDEILKKLEVEPNDLFNTSFFHSIESNKIHPFELFSTLITILPSLIFLKIDLVDNKKFRNRFIDYLEIKGIFRFNLDINLLKKELDKLNNTGKYSINYSAIYKELFLAFYKYGFVKIAENIKVETEKRTYKLDISKVLKSYDYEYKIYQSNSATNRSYSSAESFIINLQKSINKYDHSDVNDFLVEMEYYSKPYKVKYLIANILIKNIIPVNPLKKDVYNSDLRFFFISIIKEIFYESRHSEIEIVEIVNLQKKLFNKVFKETDAFQKYFKK